MSFSIVLKHVGGELKTVTVEYVAPSLTYVSIRWGQSGVYDLNLKDNKLTARSQKAQRKGKTYWQAEDINAVRSAAKFYINERYGKSAAERAANIKRHAETMPGWKGGGISAAGEPESNPRIGAIPPVDGCTEPCDHVYCSLLKKDAPMANPREHERCICPFGVLLGDCPEHGALVPD